MQSAVTHTHTCTHTRTHTHTHTHACKQQSHTHTHARTHARTHAHTHTWQAHVYSQIHNTLEPSQKDYKTVSLQEPPFFLNLPFQIFTIMDLSSRTMPLLVLTLIHNFGSRAMKLTLRDSKVVVYNTLIVQHATAGPLQVAACRQQFFCQVYGQTAKKCLNVRDSHKM